MAIPGLVANRKVTSVPWHDPSSDSVVSFPAGKNRFITYSTSNVATTGTRRLTKTSKRIYSSISTVSIGNTKGATSTETSVPNTPVNPLAYSGSDIGAQINAAIAAGCPKGQRCVVIIPAGNYTYTTTITVPTLVDLECAAGNEATLMNFSGTGTAILVSGGGGSDFRNCALNIKKTATYGINLTGGGGTGGGNIVDSITLYGGGTRTTLIGVHSNNNMISKVSIAGAIGTMVECDNAVNTFFTDLNTYGAANNTTSRTLVIDSGCDGTQIEDWSGGYSGLHGLVVQNTLGGSDPSWLFANGFITDTSSGGDGWLFDSSLGWQDNIGFQFVDSWSAAAGMVDTASTPLKSGANGIHISGGKGIRIIGSTIRDNAANGVLIDNANVGNVNIEDSSIYNNNQQNTTGSGISVTAGITNLVISGNTIGNLPGDSVNEHQTYGIEISTADSTNVVMNGNNLPGNISGGISSASPSTSGNGGIVYQQSFSSGFGGATPAPASGTVLGTLPNIPANLLEVGDTLDLTAAGDEWSGNASARYQFQFVLGELSITGCSPSELDGYHGGPWLMKVHSTVRAVGSSLGTIANTENCLSLTGPNVLTQEMHDSLPTAINTTVALTPTLRVLTNARTGSSMAFNQFTLTITRPTGQQ